MQDKADQPKKHLHPLKDYIAIGFDVDHALVRYNLPEYFPICYQSHMKVLVDAGKYPESILEFGKKEQSFIYNGLVVDKKNFLIVKLGENMEILRAYRAFTRLSNEEIEEVYGKERKLYDQLDLFKTRSDDIYVAISYFEAFFPCIYAKLLEYKISQLKEGEKLTKEINDAALKDLGHAIQVAFLHWSSKEYIPMNDYPHLYKNLSDNAEKTAVKQPRMVEILKQLKAKGKTLFIASNAHYEHVYAQANVAFGEGWDQIIDYIVVNARKPTFFLKNETAFSKIDMSTKSRIGKAETDLEPHTIYQLGNADVLEENIRKQQNGKEGRILFFGDQYSSDCLQSQTRENWDAVCIIEELDNVIYTKEGDCQETWGNYFVEETENGKINTLWPALAKKGIAKVVSKADSDEMIEFFNQDEEENREVEKKEE